MEISFVTCGRCFPKSRMFQLHVIVYWKKTTTQYQQCIAFAYPLNYRDNEYEYSCHNEVMFFIPLDFSWLGSTCYITTIACLAKQLFYQCALRDVKNKNKVHLQPSPSCWSYILLIFTSLFFIRDSSAALSEEQKPKTWQIQPPLHTFLLKRWVLTFSENRCFVERAPHRDTNLNDPDLSSVVISRNERCTYSLYGESADRTETKLTAQRYTCRGNFAWTMVTWFFHQCKNLNENN